MGVWQCGGVDQISPMLAGLTELAHVVSQHRRQLMHRSDLWKIRQPNGARPIVQLRFIVPEFILNDMLGPSCS